MNNTPTRQADNPTKRFARIDGSCSVYWFVFLGILAIGIYLRFQQISIQWLMDDEWHAVHKLIDSDGYAPILLSFGRSDYSIPLTALYKLLAETVGLSELRMRLPMLLGGTLFLGLAMLWIRKRMSAMTALVFGFLIAVSPLLINYSRNARPYMLTLLIAGLATWALARWERGGELRYAVGYLCCAWLAGWLHLIMAPFVLALLLPLYIRLLRKSGSSAIGWHTLIMISFLAIAGTLALNLPPLLGDPAAMTAKTGSGLPNLDTLTGVWHIWLGSDSSAIVLIGLALAGLGLSSVRAKLPREFRMWSSGLLAILVAILVMQPAWVHNPLTFGRYLLPMLPLLLLMIAAGIVALCRLFLSNLTQALVATSLSGLFLVGTPHADLLSHPNNFTLHSYYQFDYRRAHNPVIQSFEPYKTPSPFWHQLSKSPPGSLIVAIAGQPSFESYFVLHPLYQPLHRQILLNLETGGVCSPTLPGEAFPQQGVYLRNAITLGSQGDFARSRVNWVVLEYRQLLPGPVDTPQSYRDYIDRCRRELTARFGVPSYTDDYLVAFRVRHDHSLR